MAQAQHTTLDELYVKARRVLLDVLEALGEQRTAIILVGAQVIYVHAGEADFPLAPYTTDNDLAIDPQALLSATALERAMQRAGFTPGGQPGIWVGRDDIPVDLLVPEAVGGPGEAPVSRATTDVLPEKCGA